jgi:hypothetical protein
MADAAGRNSQLPTCALCGREPKLGTTEHHLIPRTCHSNKWFKKRYTPEQMRETIDVCRDCHKAVHNLIPSEKDLGRHYNTVESLLANSAIRRFADWAARQN